ncbi:EF-hand domain and EF-hand domain pair-containing protein [Strongyloides ratti]|uniref:EF-hand domain and EF-hand domain pair-containing protein n=1 Tax=Strongyloides ratti TaxID=34506 RepID=A0A090KZA4_STRRB|nr:EF-hand domain and EF-hand domain pair-containing protein [Strongyloides ratti]CEF60564.1 EF-hand domain and EF-hand domain pair-containing protein [Strongyloides ratti]
MNKFLIFLLIFVILSITCETFKLIPIDEDDDDVEAINFNKDDTETKEEKFLRIDEDADENLTFDEFLHSDMNYEKIKKEEFESYDRNGDGIVTKGEYYDKHKEDEEEFKNHHTNYINELFEEFDIDKNNKLNEREVENVLRKKFLLKPKSNFNHVISSFDKDGDSEWNKEEYSGFDKKLPFEEFDSVINGDKKTINL